MLNLNQIYCGDCLDLMREIPGKSVDLVLTDPPYNIKKAEWDKWKKEENYLKWCREWVLECQRVLKDNGSFYFFHNDMETISKLMVMISTDTRFVFKQMIVWNKRFDKATNKGFLDGFVVVDGLRNYQKMAEYCFFYTFQDETGLSSVMLDVNNFPTMRAYFKELQGFIGKTKTEIISSCGQQADHCFRWESSQWDLPTKETYQILINLFGIDKWGCYREYEELRREYEELRREYEELRREYEELRYTFNNQRTHHSVWNCEIAPNLGHITPKPTSLIETIILHSSNNGDVVLDPFLGSGTTALACLSLDRQFIGIEKEPAYVEIALKRLEKANNRKIAGGE